MWMWGRETPRASAVPQAGANGWAQSPHVP